MHFDGVRAQLECTPDLAEVNEMAKNTDDEELEVDLDVVEMTLPILTVHIANSLQLYNNVFTKLCT